jgi:WD40 repeat protein
MRFFVQLVYTNGSNTIELTDMVTGAHFSLHSGELGYFTRYTFSSDNKTFVSSSNDQVYFWDTTTGQLKGRYNANRTYILSICFSPNDQFLVVGDYNKKIFLLNANTFLEVRNLGLYPINSRNVSKYIIAWSNDSSQFGISCDNKKVLIFNPQNDRVMTVRTSEHFGCITSFAFTPNGTSLGVVFYRVPIIQIYSLETQSLQMQFDASVTDWRTEKPFISLAFSPLTSLTPLIAVGSLNNRVYCCPFNQESFEMGQVSIMKARHVKQVSFTSNGVQLIVKNFNGSCHSFIVFEMAQTFLATMILTGKLVKQRLPKLQEQTRRLPDELWNSIVAFL